MNKQTRDNCDRLIDWARKTNAIELEVGIVEVRAAEKADVLLRSNMDRKLLDKEEGAFWDAALAAVYVAEVSGQVLPAGFSDVLLDILENYNEEVQEYIMGWDL